MVNPIRPMRYTLVCLVLMIPALLDGLACLFQASFGLQLDRQKLAEAGNPVALVPCVAASEFAGRCMVMTQQSG